MGQDSSPDFVEISSSHLKWVFCSTVLDLVPLDIAGLRTSIKRTQMV